MQTWRNTNKNPAQAGITLTGGNCFLLMIVVGKPAVFARGVADKPVDQELDDFTGALVGFF